MKLEAPEMREVEGGRKLPIPGPWGWAASALLYIVDNWDDISDGYKNGYEAAQ